MTAHRVGIVINPAAGIGGPLGWHGSDDPRSDVDSDAAQVRALRTLTAFAGHAAGLDVTLLTAAGPMGADAATAAGHVHQIVYSPPGPRTTPADTQGTVAAMMTAGAGLILFAGGDGTARDVCSVTGHTIPVIGIPAGVKMHSGVFGRTPESTAKAAIAYLKGHAPAIPADVVDLDEAARERGDLTTRLFGQLLVPHSLEVQRGKVARRSDGADVTGIATELRELLKVDHGWIFGPGTTMQAVGAALGWELSLLGVDLVIAGRVERDVSAEQLSYGLGGAPAQVIVSPIGGQGMVLGRGNQPIGPELLWRLDPAELVILCLPDKLAELRGELYLDTPDADLNRRFTGVRRVITGYRQEATVMVR